MTDVLTTDFVGLGAAWDFMAASAGTTDMRAVRTTTITYIAPYSGVSRSFWGHCGMGLHAAIANFKNSDNAVNLSDGRRLRSTSGNQLSATPAA
jgi:hypothetical protein